MKRNVIAFLLVGVLVFFIVVGLAKADDFKNTSKEINGRYLKMAISTGVLGGNADVDDLTVLVRQEMINRYVLRDAIFYGFLSKKATTESLTTEIRTKMKRAGLLKRYLPDGTINKF